MIDRLPDSAAALLIVVGALFGMFTTAGAIVAVAVTLRGLLA